MIEQALERLHERLLAAAGPGTPALATTIGDARVLADGLAAEASLSAAGTAFAGAAIAALVAAGRIGPGGVGELLDDAHRLTRAERVPTALAALGDPAPLRGALDVALHTHVTIIAGAAGLRDVAAWRIVLDGAVEPVAASSPTAFDATRPDVARVFCGDERELPLTVVLDGDDPSVVLAWSPPIGGCAPRVLTARSASALALAVERAQLVTTEIAQHADLARAAKRRLTRVAFDLHDGPLQDLALMRHELAGLRRRLVELGSDAAVAQLDDVLAVADSTETDLRELSTSMTSSSLTQRPFDEALRGVVRGFSLRSGLEPQLTLTGEVDGLTAMERVALLRIIGEALANVREHSAAQHVVVSVEIGATHVEATVIDDGCGFDLQTALPAAARRGSMGLLGIIERMRLLNGTWDVQSAEGRGTSIVATFDRFLPGAEQTPAGSDRDAA